MVEIESHWTAARREKLGIYPTTRQDSAERSRPSLRDRTGHRSNPLGLFCCGGADRLRSAGLGVAQSVF